MRQTAISDFDYHGNAAARAEAGRDGLVSVGDVGYLDADGYLFLCDRKRDMVISGGVNIYPAEIENALIGMDGVRDCAVFGVPDAEYGERLFACVEPEAGAKLSAAAVQAFLRAKLANFKVPKDIQFLDALPREASRQNLQAQAARSLQRGPPAAGGLKQRFKLCCGCAHRASVAKDRRHQQESIMKSTDFVVARDDLQLTKVIETQLARCRRAAGRSAAGEGDALCLHRQQHHLRRARRSAEVLVAVSGARRPRQCAGVGIWRGGRLETSWHRHG